MKKSLRWLALAAVVTVTGCAGMEANVSTPVADVSATTTVNEKGKVGVAASASKTIDTGLGTKAKIGLDSKGGGLRVDAVDQRGTVITGEAK